MCSPNGGDESEARQDAWEIEEPEPDEALSAPGNVPVALSPDGHAAVGTISLDMLAARVLDHRNRLAVLAAAAATDGVPFLAPEACLLRLARSA